MHEALKKLHAHPLFISDYVVYYARVACTFILVSPSVCVCVCVCVCVFIQLFELAKSTGIKNGAKVKFFCAGIATWNCCFVIFKTFILTAAKLLTF